MEDIQTHKFTVSQLLTLTNDMFNVTLGEVNVEGEVASFSVNHNKYVFFDLKDQDSTVSCFLMLFNLRMPIENGMKIRIKATPKVTARGHFSLTVREIHLEGEGDLKRSFELLKNKLEKEGLFDQSRKRSLPKMPQSVAVISSVQAAGYIDFVKLINQKIGGTKFDVYCAQLQGVGAADSIIQALQKCNLSPKKYQAIVIVRGGGSDDDLVAFNDEQLARAIFSSQIPVLTGIGHEKDYTIADLVADVRASTPSNAADILLMDKELLLVEINQTMSEINYLIGDAFSGYEEQVARLIYSIREKIKRQIDELNNQFHHYKTLIYSRDPDKIFKLGYALLQGEVEIGKDITITNDQYIIKAEVKNYEKR